MKKVQNENGLTLTELLAVLALSTIIIGLLTTALITVFRNNDQTQSHIDLRQEANIIVTKLRTTHEKDYNNLDDRIYFLAYDKDEENVVIITNDSEQEQLTSPDYGIRGLVKNGSGKGVIIKNEKGKNNACTKDIPELELTELVDDKDNLLCVSRDEPLVLTMILFDKKEQKEFEIDTVINHAGTATNFTGETGTNPDLNPPNDPEEPSDPDQNPGGENPENPDPNPDPGGEDPETPPNGDNPPKDENGGSCSYQNCNDLLCYVLTFLVCTVELIIQALEAIGGFLANLIRMILSSLGIL